MTLWLQSESGSSLRFLESNPGVMPLVSFINLMKELKNLVKELLGFDEQLNKLMSELEGKSAFFKKWLSVAEDDFQEYSDCTTWSARLLRAFLSNFEFLIRSRMSLLTP